MLDTWLEGQLIRVVWSSPTSGYSIVRVLSGEGEITVVGALASLADLDSAAFVSFEGKWEEHATHGRQFRASGYLIGSPKTLEGIQLYLETVPGIGPKLAGKIVDHFGMATTQVLATAPWRLSEVSGIKKKAKEIAERWAADERGRALTIRLRGLGLTERRIEQIRQRYREQALDIIDREPYRLAEEIRGIGFRTADAMARANGIPLDHPGRIRAAILHILEVQESEGHCYLPRRVLIQELKRMEVDVANMDAGIEALVTAGRLVVEPAIEPQDWAEKAIADDEDYLWRTPLFAAEHEVASGLLAIQPSKKLHITEPEVEQIESSLRITLDIQQREAIVAALRGGVTVITGGPGTGKTTLVSVLLAAWRKLDLSFAIASPTGRAAKRLEETTGESASTLHRLLEIQGGKGFARGPGNPLEIDALVIDEMSMVDISLAAAVVAAIPRDRPFSLVLVGDVDQLPSVGPGQVLRDIIGSNNVSVMKLDRVFRQDQDSGIVNAAIRIHQGDLPDSGTNSGHDDFFIVQRDEGERAAETVIQIVERLAQKGFDPWQDIQVLAPMRKGAVGTEILNRMLQQRFNADGIKISRGEREFRVGDRVICTKNRYDLEIFNGDVGRITSARKEGMDVEIDGRILPWNWEDFATIELAYALTIHKSQGSEYPAVVLALHDSHMVMLKRNLLYTAVTRAKKFLCLVTSSRALQTAVRRNDVEGRYTALAKRLREVDHKPQEALLEDVWGELPWPE